MLPGVDAGMLSVLDDKQRGVEWGVKPATTVGCVSSVDTGTGDTEWDVMDVGLDKV